jgi:predicted RNA-binding Zn-ribbon protein involved in translation (DUF1610 family)
MTITEIDEPEFDDTCPNCGEEMEYQGEDFYGETLKNDYKCSRCGLIRTFRWELVDVVDDRTDVVDLEEGVEEVEDNGE